MQPCALAAPTQGMAAPTPLLQRHRTPAGRAAHAHPNLHILPVQALPPLTRRSAASPLPAPAPALPATALLPCGGSSRAVACCAAAAPPAAAAPASSGTGISSTTAHGVPRLNVGVFGVMNAGACARARGAGRPTGAWSRRRLGVLVPASRTSGACPNSPHHPRRRGTEACVPAWRQRRHGPPPPAPGCSCASNRKVPAARPCRRQVDPRQRAGPAGGVHRGLHAWHHRRRQDRAA